MTVTLLQRIAQFMLSIAGFSKQDLYLKYQAANGLILPPMMKTTNSYSSCTCKDSESACIALQCNINKNTIQPMLPKVIKLYHFGETLQEENYMRQWKCVNHLSTITKTTLSSLKNISGMKESLRSRWFCMACQALGSLNHCFFACSVTGELLSEIMQEFVIPQLQARSDLKNVIFIQKDPIPTFPS